MDGTAKIWDSAHLQTSWHIPALASFPFRLASIEPKGKPLISATSIEGLFSDKLTGQVFFTDDEHNSRAFAASPDGRYILTVEPLREQSLKRVNVPVCRIWEAVTGKWLCTLGPPEGLISGFAFLPDGRHVVTIATAHTSKPGRMLGIYTVTASVWDTQDGRRTGHYTLSSKSQVAPVNFVSLSFSPTGRYAVMCNAPEMGKAMIGDPATVWDTNSGKIVGEFGPNFCAATAFLPDGKRVIAGCKDGSARIWDVQSGKLLQTFTGHTQPITSVAVSPDGQRILTGSMDKTVRMWDTLTGRAVLTLEISDYVFAVAFARKNRYIIVGSQPGYNFFAY